LIAHSVAAIGFLGLPDKLGNSIRRSPSQATSRRVNQCTQSGPIRTVAAMRSAFANIDLTLAKKEAHSPPINVSTTIASANVDKLEAASTHRAAA
jgi:hypothetical protein